MIVFKEKRKPCLSGKLAFPASVSFCPVAQRMGGACTSADLQAKTKAKRLLSGINPFPLMGLFQHPKNLELLTD